MALNRSDRERKAMFANMNNPSSRHGVIKSGHIINPTSRDNSKSQRIIVKEGEKKAVFGSGHRNNNNPSDDDMKEARKRFGSSHLRNMPNNPDNDNNQQKKDQKNISYIIWFSYCIRNIKTIKTVN